jgi:hypothetical protein
VWYLQWPLLSEVIIGLVASVGVQDQHHAQGNGRRRWAGGAGRYKTWRSWVPVLRDDDSTAAQAAGTCRTLDSCTPAARVQPLDFKTGSVPTLASSPARTKAMHSVELAVSDRSPPELNQVADWNLGKEACEAGLVIARRRWNVALLFASRQRRQRRKEEAEASMSLAPSKTQLHAPATTRNSLPAGRLSESREGVNTKSQCWKPTAQGGTPRSTAAKSRRWVNVSQQSQDGQSPLLC